MKLALIDADSIYFRAACSASNSRELKKKIDSIMNETLFNCGTVKDKAMVAVKGKGNFRKDIFKDYKATRKPLDEKIAKNLSIGHAHMLKKWNAVEADGMEADDLVSIWAHESKEMDVDYIICGIDKDLKQIPGHHYNFNKRIFDEVNEDQANMCLMLQCLTGDTSDNIPGIKGIGPKKAEKILKDIPMDSRWSVVETTWFEMKAGDPKLSKRLLTMLTSWEELEEVSNKGKDNDSCEDKSETSEREQDVCEEGEDDIQVKGLHDLPTEDSGTTEEQ